MAGVVEVDGVDAGGLAGGGDAAVEKSGGRETPLLMAHVAGSMPSGQQ